MDGWMDGWVDGWMDDLQLWLHCKFDPQNSDPLPIRTCSQQNQTTSSSGCMHNVRNLTLTQSLEME